MGRGRSEKSKNLVAAARTILEQIQPCTVRAVCYRLFAAGYINSMARGETNRVSRNLTWAREEDAIPWGWIVDETREAERPGTWADPERFAAAALRSFRRDRWGYQPIRVEVWSEKGTVRGTLAPVLDQYGVTFRVFHGFSSATAIREVANEYRDRPLRVYYVGDYDPSGLYMSEVDLPGRLGRYGAHLHLGGEYGGRSLRGDEIELERVALLNHDLDLPSFDVETKRGDPRYRWYRMTTGKARAWELDAMSPPNLRSRIEEKILKVIDREAWHRTGLAEQAEQESLREVLSAWGRPISRQVQG